MEQDSDNYKLRMRELNLKEMELKKSRLLNIVKIITTGVVVTLIPAIINHQIQQQEIEIKRLEGEIEYLDKFSVHVVEQDDLTKRRNFVEYLATIAHSEKSRERWKTYLSLVDALAKKQEEYDNAISSKEDEARQLEEKLADLEKEKEIMRAKNEKSNELIKLEESLKTAKNKLKKIELEIFANASERENLIRKSRLSNTEVTLDTQIQGLVLQMNSDNRTTRISAVAKLIENHKSSRLAISSALDFLKLPQLETLSASGKINVLVFLRNTTPSAWDSELIERAYDAIELIRRREVEDSVYIGPQTEDALMKLETFLKKTT